MKWTYHEFDDFLYRIRDSDTATIMQRFEPSIGFVDTSEDINEVEWYGSTLSKSEADKIIIGHTLRKTSAQD